MGLFTIGVDGTGIDTMTFGVSKKGMESYIENLKIELLDNVEEKLESVTEIQAAIDKGWQGKSRDKFYEDFNQSIEKVKEDIKSEFNDLQGRLNELANQYYKQDENLLG